ncbi:MAG: RNA 2',3'-cyclic phosphodiesterase [Methanomassiliicoccales archaeon]
MSFRAFISMDVAVHPKIVEFSKELRRRGSMLKVVDPNIIHLTFKFLGETDEVLIPRIREAMERSVEGVAPMSVRFKGVGAFPSISRIKVVWIGVEGGENMSLIARRLDDELSFHGFKREERPFAPHITLARMREGGSAGFVRELLDASMNEEFGVQLMDALSLKKSVLSPKGPTYSTVEEVRLKGV